MNTNNPRYWFRAKRYGLGWGLPLVWQGWVFLLAWIVAVLVGHRLLVPGDKVLRWTFTGAMLILCRKPLVDSTKGSGANRAGTPRGRAKCQHSSTAQH